MTKIAAFLLGALACTQVHAQPGPRVPSPEALATVPGLTAAQQADVRKALTERRDALEALHDKTRGEMQALHKRVRAERERIDEANADKLRKLLGDEGYKSFAAWRAEHRGGGHGAMGPHVRRIMRGGPGHGPGSADGAAPAQHGAPMADLAALPPPPMPFDDGDMPDDEAEF